jgi:hypothetical protein
MSAHNGSWYVRFPDGRVVLARSTQAVRYHIERGRIPANSRVRRTAEEKWQSLEGTPDFADLLAPPAPPPDAISAEPRDNGRTNTALGKSNVEYRVFGVGALVNELFNAIDLSLHRHKLWTTLAATMLWAVGLIGFRLILLTEGIWQYGLSAAVGLILLFAGGLAAAAVAQMTLVEMLHRRRAHWQEIRPHLLKNAWNILLSQVLFLAGIWVPIQALGHFNEFFRDGNPPEALLGIALTLHLVLEIFFLPLAGMGLLLAPIIVVEECSCRKALAIWWELLRTDLSRTFLYETLAVALGLVLNSPLFLPVVYAGWDQALFANKHLAAVSQATLHVLGGLAVTPFAAYLVVANVFIYLNMRYEFYSPNR